jgi:uncharacterized membrane protein
MNGDDILVLILAMVFAFITGYVVGKISMLGEIVRAVVEEAEKEQAVEGKVQPDNMLTVEKHNDMYYAYVDGNFAAQGATFVDLFTAMKSNKNYEAVNITRTTAADLNLSREDAESMAEAIVAVYGDQARRVK